MNVKETAARVSDLLCRSRGLGLCLQEGRSEEAGMTPFRIGPSGGQSGRKYVSMFTTSPRTKIFLFDETRARRERRQRGKTSKKYINDTGKGVCDHRGFPVDSRVQFKPSFPGAEEV